MKPEFTPGLGRHTNRKVYFGDVHVADAVAIAYDDKRANQQFGARERAANARLLAASPLGYQVLVRLNEMFRHHNPCDPSMPFDDQRTMKRALEDYLAQVHE